MERYEILHTLAEVATAFAGFTGIVVVLGRRSIGEWRSNEKTIVSVLLASSLGVVLFAFVPDLGSAAQLSPSTTWRVSAFLFASYHLVVILASLVAIRRALARGETLPDVSPRDTCHNFESVRPGETAPCWSNVADGT